LGHLRIAFGSLLGRFCVSAMRMFSREAWLPRGAGSDKSRCPGLARIPVRRDVEPRARLPFTDRRSAPRSPGSPRGRVPAGRPETFQLCELPKYQSLSPNPSASSRRPRHSVRLRSSVFTPAHSSTSALHLPSKNLKDGPIVPLLPFCAKKCHFHLCPTFVLEVATFRTTSLYHNPSISFRVAKIFNSRSSHRGHGAAFVRNQTKKL